MHLGYLFFLVIHSFSAENRAEADRVRVNRLLNGVDEFEVLNDDGNGLCAESKKVEEFCVKRDAISVQNTISCEDFKKKVHCRCVSSKSTFLLHKGKCVNNRNVTRYLHGGSNPVCRFHLNDGNVHHLLNCQESSISTLSTNISNARSYSLCTSDLTIELYNCKINPRTMSYSEAGRWRDLWRLDPRGDLASTQDNTLSLEKVFDKLISNVSRYSGFILSFQATCQTRSSFRLRGIPPSDPIRSCVLLKVSGSRIWPLQKHQMNFTPSKEITRKLNITIIKKAETEESPTSQTSATDLITAETKMNSVDDSPYLRYIILLCAGVVSLIVVLLCLTGFVFYGRSNRRRKWQRSGGSVANPTYERGHDRGLVLVQVSTLSPTRPPSVAFVSPYAIVYQPGHNNLYESLRSIKNNPALRRHSYSIYQDLVSAGNASSYQEALARTRRISFPSSNDSKSPTGASNAPCDYATVRKKVTREPGEKCSRHATKAADFIVTCPSLPSSSLRREEMANAVEITGCSSSILSLSSLQFYDGEDQNVDDLDSMQKNDSCVENQPGELATIQSNENMHRVSDMPHDDIHEHSLESGLSGLEFILDSDCSESDSAFGEAIDESENQSPFYYVLEESEKTPGEKLYISLV